ncbi:hypothetical protein Tsubulata_001838 [Turnera subulata]|uniref:Ethylene insensitive 3-like DNA-binding domain-containing protein n=1 Tax=Turnera subulata TaxID=218843 RepID=A0A9Q0G4X8_9ROSI|nr:hypothetical protein Tsubulata_001838 [Turnera subulata]
MSMFDEMGFCGDMDFFSMPMGEGDVSVPPVEAEATVEDDYSDEEIDVDELERRMWRDKLRLKRLKEQNKSKEGIDVAKQRQSQEQARRKKMSRAQDGILKYMLKMMEVCKAQGFVYGIIPEKGKPVTGASDNLREWWKDKVSEYDVEGVDDEPNFDVQECKSDNLNCAGLGMERMRERLPLGQHHYPVKGEIVTNVDFIRKRKPSCDASMMVDQKIYTCEFPRCPYSQIRLAFQDRASREKHQLNCPYRNTSGDFGGSNFHVNEVKPVIYSQPKPATCMVNAVSSAFDLSGVPEDGQKMISELMSMYDTNILGNKSAEAANSTVASTEGHSLLQPEIQHQQANYFQGQGNVMEGNVFADSGIQSNLQMYSQEGGAQFDRFKSLNSPFETNQSNNFNMMFGSPFDLASFDYKEDLHGFTADTLPKHQDVSVWF